MPVSWDEALDITARTFADHAKAFGPRSVVFLRGAAKGLQDSYLTRFANAFGSPNISSMAHVCFIPRHAASLLTYGFHAIPDLDGLPKTIIIWGETPSDTLFHVYERIARAVAAGATLITVDPGTNRATREARIAVRVRPGGDLHLVLAMLHVIIAEGLFDRAFVEKHCTGFEDLATHVAAYTPKGVADITWVPAETIVRLARTYALEKPSVIQWGNGIDHGPDNFQTARAICILRAVTGNLGIPGSDVQWAAPPLLGRGSAAFALHDLIPQEVRAERITGGAKLLPDQFYALPQALVKTMITGHPYPVRSCYIQGCNPLLTYPDARKVRRALESMDFVVVADMFMTPTASLADIVLPVTTYLEFDGIVTAPYSMAVASVQQKVVRTGACRSDYEILQGLAERLGFADAFWPTEEACLDAILAPAGTTFSRFREEAVMVGRMLCLADLEKGFPTPSGKVELFSPRLESWGFPALPTPCPPVAADGEYPLVMTSTKVGAYRHSGGRQVAPLRRTRRSPLVVIHPDTAGTLGISEGDLVTIETRQGRIVQRATLNRDVEPRVVVADFAWWFPEREGDPMGGWDESNLNVLIPDAPPFGAELGTPRLRGIACRIRKDVSQEVDR